MLKSLSGYDVAKAWLDQVEAADRVAAAAMLDAMLLLNEEQVSTAIRSQLYKLADGRAGKRRRMALYAERELGSKTIFKTETIPDSDGRMRRRAVGKRGPAPVKPIRGSNRVGSEGPIAFIISQVTEGQPKSFMNHPGPDFIRGKTRPAGSIVIVTDFIGSGSRVRAMLDAFWANPSVRAWHSRHWIDFKVVAAAGTMTGCARVRGHRVRPEVFVEFVVTTMAESRHPLRSDWLSLLDKYGPDAGRGADRYGFGGSAALVAFNYRIPNNTPAILHKSSGQWRALYDGAAPESLRGAFGVRSPEEVVDAAAEATGLDVAGSLSPADASLVLVLSLIRGKWRPGVAVALAERTGLALPDVIDLGRRAAREGMLNADGRLTDKGQAFLVAGRKHERKRPDIPTNKESYYPTMLGGSTGLI